MRGIIKNSGYLFSSNSIAMALSMLQGILAVRLLGLDGYGIVVVIIPFITNIHKFLSFRMSELVVRYLGQYLVEGKKEHAAAVVKGAALVEASTSFLAYAVLALLAPLAARYIAKDLGTAPFFLLYGLVLFSNMFYETSKGVLQINRLFGKLASVNLVQSVITATLILLAYLLGGGIFEVLFAYLAGKTFAGVGVAVVAAREVARLCGSGWWRASLRLLPERRELARFAISTNLHETVNLLARDNETIFISFLRTPGEAAYFRVAQSVINMVMLPIDPFIATTYAEITHTISKREWALTRRVLKRVSAISAVWTIGVGAVLALFGWWLIPFLYGAEAAPAYPAVLILLIGYGFANIFNWNRPLLLALGLPDYPLKVSALVGVGKTLLTFGFVWAFGYLMEAAILSSYFIVSIAVILRRGLAEIRRREALSAAGGQPVISSQV